jgi:hypothetical protein
MARILAGPAESVNRCRAENAEKSRRPTGAPVPVGSAVGNRVGSAVGNGGRPNAAEGGAERLDHARIRAPAQDWGDYVHFPKSAGFTLETVCLGGRSRQ